MFAFKKETEEVATEGDGERGEETVASVVPAVGQGSARSTGSSLLDQPPPDSKLKEATPPPERPSCEAEMMFSQKKAQHSGIPKDSLCPICESRCAEVSCGCCPSPVRVCGSCCLIRHTEGRYQKHEPDEESERFDQIAKLEDPPKIRCKEPSKGLVLISPFDGIGGAMRALELLKVKPALYISLDLSLIHI